ncbi:hypothetical protein PybrP1_005394 [[Pythium] brassicae (nom. inval.)]|nr:hypothetical protein PybrP1_005394 [[Pythium] brassicae (nom. inval.)]
MATIAASSAPVWRLALAQRLRGWDRDAFAPLQRLRAFDELFDLTGDRVLMRQAFSSPEERTRAFLQVASELQREGAFPTWQSEVYAAKRSFGAPTLFHYNRGVDAYFGLSQFATHLNGFVSSDDNRDGDRRRASHVWIAKRSAVKKKWPGLLDTIAGGGLPAHISAHDNMAKEAGEEAGLDPAWVSPRLVSTGSIRHVVDEHSGLPNNTMFIYDIELPRDVTPVNRDGEVECFELWAVGDVVAALWAEPKRFKPDIRLVLLDFFVRHGLLTPDTFRDFQELQCNGDAVSKNLPAYVDSKRLREHFAAQGEVTDAAVVRTKDGRASRRFGFVGYKTSEQAQAACAFFHQSFFDTCRINVRFAIQRESEEMARPWSKYSAGSSRFQGTTDAKKLSTDAAEEQDPKRQKKTAKQQKPVDESSSEFQQFMETMQARSKTRFWANDDVQGPEAQAKAEAAALLHADDLDDDDGEYQEIKRKGGSESDDDGTGAGKSGATAMSDLDFLRSKVSKTVDDDSQSEASGSEKEYAEDIEADDDDGDEGEGEKSSGERIKTQSGKHAGAADSVDAADEPEKPSARLFVRNLPYSAEEEDLTDLFSAYGPILEVHMPLDDTKRRKGFGFVLFKSTVDAQAALSALNGFAFQGRLLHVFFAKMKPEKVDPEQLLQNPNLTYKQKKELERQIAASKQTGWNASFIRGDATVGSLAQRMGVKRGDILDKENGNMAVRLAIGETMLVKENKDFFADEGVDLDAIEGALVKSGGGGGGQKPTAPKVERSTTVILVKNLPHTTEEEELAQMFRKHGEIGRFLLPPSKTLALVEFFEPSEARKAFRSLAYKKYQHVPLYLEWAPVKVFNKHAPRPSQADTKGVKAAAAPGVPDVADDDENAADARNTICVKNLSFATKEPTLEKLFRQVGGVRKVTIARRKDPKRGLLSMGFGFVEFDDTKHADAAIAALQATVLDGHALNLKTSQKKLAPAAKRKADSDGAGVGAGRQSKIIVRNVAFEATSHEIRELFGAFGQLKRVRMPKKFDGKHRGFAFVEFLTEQEAQSAFAALASSHLYGRHLVLEWAEDADDIDTLRAKASRDLSAIADTDRRKRTKRADGDDDQDQDDNEHEY